LQEKHNFTPLAARIYAILILSPADGCTFDELVVLTEASKSSVSTNLNLLNQLKYAEFFTKPGDRKRYFRTTGNYLRFTLVGYLETVEKDLRLVEKINTYNCKNNPAKFQRNESAGLIFQRYLKSQKENLKATIEKMESSQKDKVS
jgi:DNA-binding transcriptional regulator GbsR (MarR family)